MSRKLLVRESLYVDSDSQVQGSMDIQLDDIYEIIDRTRGEDFTPEEFDNFLEFLLEMNININEALNIIKYLFGVHPHMQDDIIKGEGLYKDLLDSYLEAISPQNNSRNIPPLSMN